MIIDTHVHIGDLLFGKNITFKQNVVKRDHHNLLYQIEANDNRLPETFEGIDPVIFDESIRNEEQARNCIATLQNLQKSLDRNNIDKVWVLPVLPNVGFEEVLAASKLENRIIPFTCIDFSLPKDEAVKKILEDVGNGAMGLKVHPIIQMRPMDDETIEEVLQAWKTIKKPVIFHTYQYSYYHPEESYRNRPDYGSNPGFLRLAREFPELTMIAAHSGGPMDFPEILAGKDIKNLYVDTSFQPAEVIEQFVSAFGPERVMLGSDWPWGYQETPLKVLNDAAGGDKTVKDLLFFKNALRLMEEVQNE